MDNFIMQYNEYKKRLPILKAAQKRVLSKFEDLDIDLLEGDTGGLFPNPTVEIPYFYAEKYVRNSHRLTDLEREIKAVIITSEEWIY